MLKKKSDIHTLKTFKWCNKYVFILLDWPTDAVRSNARSSVSDLQCIVKDLATILNDMNEQKLRMNNLVKNVDDFSVSCYSK